MTRLFETGVLVVNVFAGGHELGSEAGNLLLSDFIGFGVTDTAFNLQFLYCGLGFQYLRLEIVGTTLQPSSHMI